MTTRHPVTVAGLWLLTLGAAPAQEAATMTVTDAPPAGRATLYPGNRAPLRAGALTKLPVGAVRPEGWLRAQLELEAEGYTGRLSDISPWCKFDDSAWASAVGQGKNPWEELPYWLKGYVSLGFVLGDQRITDESRRWLEAVLKSQRADGWFGPEANLEGNDLWPNMCMVYALRTWHEATGDERVVPFLSNYFTWQLSLGPDKLLAQVVDRGWWQKIRAGDNLDSIYWLYNRTGEPWLLDLARLNHQHTAPWVTEVASWHGVNLCECFREPAQFFELSGDESDLAATVRNYDEAWGLYGQVPGGMFGADENARPGYTGPRQAAESCSMVEFMHSAELLTAITGDTVWADRCEDVAFNSLPASMTPDLKGLHYLTAPNQIQLDRQNKAPLIQNGGDMFSYNPFGYRCCQHNVAFGWPYFAERLWMATAGDGLAAVFYAPSRVTAKVNGGVEVEWTETTDYPFGDEVVFRLDTPRAVAFPLVLRVPVWCEGATVAVNGTAVEGAIKPGSWVTLQRTWQAGDMVRLTLPMTIKVTNRARNHGAASVQRGPLSYSLKIGERWERWGGTDAFPASEVYPTTPWNYGLVLQEGDPAASFEVVRHPVPPGQPFDLNAAPIELRATGRRIPEWKQEGNGLVGEIQDSPVRSAEPDEAITLIPMGCARLRISSFPVIGDGPDAHVWTEPPPPPQASHCWDADTTNALCDGLIPRNSNDHSIPRMTWWDHRGTQEWVQYDWEAPRQVGSCEVYWFDDTGVGQCRVPASWQLLWLDGETWRPVANASEYGVKPDQFNKVTFDAVTTRSLRLQVQLQEGVSGGILEWPVGN